MKVSLLLCIAVVGETFLKFIATATTVRNSFRKIFLLQSNEKSIIYKTSIIYKRI